MKHFLIGAALIAAGLAAPALAQDPTSVWDGVYTTDQANRGGPVYAAQCTACHGPSPFLERFEGQPLSELFSFVRTRMPDGNPGSLGAQDYADSIAYLLQQSGMPPGPNELGTQSRTMTGILFTIQPPAGHPAATTPAAAPLAAPPPPPATPPAPGAANSLVDNTHG